MISDTKYSD